MQFREEYQKATAQPNNDRSTPAEDGLSSSKLKTRNQLFRIQSIHNCLQVDRFPNCTVLAERLEVNVRTIRRDIDCMRDRLALPVEYDPSVRGYRYTRYVDSLPLQSFNQKEANTLEQAISLVSDPQLKKALAELLDKILGLGGLSQATAQ